MRPPLLVLCLFTLLPCLLRGNDIPALWAERTACTVAVEYMVEAELERHETSAFGTVLDGSGLIALPPMAINLRNTPQQLRNFLVHTPGSTEGSPASYLGVDPVSGWHFVRADASLAPKLRPVTDFLPKDTSLQPVLTEEVWGIGLRGKDEDFLPYVMASRVALINRLPLRTAIAQQEVTAPGLPVFNQRGELLGIGLNSFGQTYLQFSQAERGGARVMLVNIEETSAFLVLPEVLPWFTRVPDNPFGRPMAWLGTFGLQPVDNEVAKFLKLENQSAAVVGEILEASPAEKAGLKERDVIVALDGVVLPRFRPNRAVADYIDHKVDTKKPGETLSLTVIRAGERLTIDVPLEDSPKLAREARRQYFEKLGFTGRECVYSDAVMRRARAAEAAGLIVHFVKPGSAAASAGLQPEDWIKSIDGTEARDCEAALAQLAAIEKDGARADFVLLVSRGGDTSILRIKLK